MSKIDRPTFLVDILEDDRQINYHLTKPNDPNFLKKAEKIKWIEFNENGTFKETRPEIEIGSSLVLDPHFGSLFTWLTTEIIEIVEQSDDYITFKTKNSLYKLSKL